MFVFQPWHLLVAVIGSWINRHQQMMIAFQNDQLESVLHSLGNKRIKLSDEDRRRLAVKAKQLGRKTLFEITTIVTPDTILRWHRQLVASKWDYSDRKKRAVGRPPVPTEVKHLIVKLARENPQWGYDRISGTLNNLGHKVCDQTVGNVLKENGIEPAPKRQQQTSWKEFLKAHWEVLASTDFTSVEVWTPRGLVTYYLLFVMDLSSRKVEFAGITTNPIESWMNQIGRNLTDCDEGFLRAHEQLIMDRDGKFCPSFRQLIKDTGVTPKRLPPRSPNLNAHIERFMKSIKHECLNRMIFFGEGMLTKAVNEYLQHYHHERNHQGLENCVIDPEDDIGGIEGKVECKKRLGGMLKYYHRKAA